MIVVNGKRECQSCEQAMPEDVWRERYDVLKWYELDGGVLPKCDDCLESEWDDYNEHQNELVWG